MDTKVGSGVFAEATFADLLAHAVDELVHHAAEIGRMRDIYRALNRA